MVHCRPLEPDRGHVLTALSSDAAIYIAALTGAAPARAELWADALTHGSMGEARDYQRLEFLGDRVLGLVIADWLYEKSDAAEGKLSQRLNALVARETCADVARAIALPPHIRLGKQARDDGGKESDNILGDVMEALIGALFVERGFDAARTFVRKLWHQPMESGTGQRKHPKAALQEWAAGNRRKPPVYTLVTREGPDHAATFTVSVEIKGVGEASARGSSKQEAETAAAKAFMQAYA
ncbi:ribonuclease III [Novosphingobium sp. SL115]|uniref:ribonuclease III n=1 Tax=Novosphingobium sp. SL115 TaxID=2995150 RepID=UPI002276FFA5|nr:ribonuclease III [Novosphingobium sp. SL115]MCY1671844.1 ribonuclease III [Novosphingobium sp. SL115]